MKKLLTLLLSIFMLGCSSKTPVETGVTITNPVETESIKADMSHYEFLKDSDPAFREITSEEFARIISLGATGVFYFGYENCPFCNRAVPELNTVAKNLGVEVYYVDTNKLTYETYLDIVPYIEASFDGHTNDVQGEFLVPDVITYKNGEMIGFHRSLVSSYKRSEAEQMNDEQKKELQDIYEKMIRDIAN